MGPRQWSLLHVSGSSRATRRTAQVAPRASTVPQRPYVDVIADVIAEDTRLPHWRRITTCRRFGWLSSCARAIMPQRSIFCDSIRAWTSPVPTLSKTSTPPIFVAWLSSDGSWPYGRGSVSDNSRSSGNCAGVGGRSAGGLGACTRTSNEQRQSCRADIL